MFDRGSRRWRFALVLLCITGCGRDDRGQTGAGNRNPGGGNEQNPGQIEPVASFIDETPPAELSDPTSVALVARYSDPRHLLQTGLYWPLYVAESEDESCPQIIDESDMTAGTVRWRIQGGCSYEDDEGIPTHYDGQIVAEGDANGTVIRQEGFRLWWTTKCNGQLLEYGWTLDGETRVPYAFALPYELIEPSQDEEEFAAGHYEVQTSTRVDYPDETCAFQTDGLAYDARVDVQVETLKGGGVSAQATIYQMEGRAAVRELPEFPDDVDDILAIPYDLHPQQEAFTGSWEMFAADYTSAAYVCYSEPLAGTLTMQAAGNEATIFPDGAQSCDDEVAVECAPWSQNGQAQSEQVCEYSGCSAGRDAPPSWLALMILLAGLLWQRRRMRRAEP